MYSPAPVLGCVQAVVGLVSGPIVSVSPGLVQLGCVIKERSRFPDIGGEGL